MTVQELDAAQVEAFAGRLFTVLNGAGLTLLISLGHRTGLFDAMATRSPSTSEQIAKAAGLDERYVREWLGGVVAGQIVEYTPSSQTYALPPAHAALLTRAAGHHNLAAFAQMVPVNASVEPLVVESFRNG